MWFFLRGEGGVYFWKTLVVGLSPATATRFCKQRRTIVLAELCAVQHSSVRSTPRAQVHPTFHWPAHRQAYKVLSGARKQHTWNTAAVCIFWKQDQATESARQFEDRCPGEDKAATFHHAEKATEHQRSSLIVVIPTCGVSNLNAYKVRGPEPGINFSPVTPQEAPQ